MNFRDVSFESAAGLFNQLPESDLPELVFSGKSNVGKSSLINKLVGRKALARVSGSPGKTATINFYRLPECRLVDLPGYGYAKVSHGEKKRWAELVEGFLAQPRKTALLIQILDARHKPTGNDMDMLNFLLETELPFLVACTKSDKLNKTETAQQQAFFTELFREAKLPFIFCSAVKGTGMEALQKQIEDAVRKEQNREG